MAPSATPTKAPVTAVPSASPTFATLAPTRKPVSLWMLIQSVPVLSTLSSAITAADMNRNSPPFLATQLDESNVTLTVFAPTNTAFNAIDKLVPGYVEKLMKPEYGLHLTTILGYHVTQGKVVTTKFPIPNQPMLEGGNTNATRGENKGDFQVESYSSVAGTLLDPVDTPATNGILQVIDNVLLPQFVQQTLADVLMANPDRFSTLLRLIKAAGLEDQLRKIQGVTLLAPNNNAIPPETEQFLLMPGNNKTLVDVLLYHVIDQVFNYAAETVPNILLVHTVQGENIVVGLVVPNNIEVSYNQARQVDTLLTRDNIIYEIDTVLVPFSLSTVVPRSIPDIQMQVIVAQGLPQQGNHPQRNRELLPQQRKSQVMRGGEERLLLFLKTKRLFRTRR
jgi:uncharacterized surface protein with fasciclin (FAS1) repeats